MKQVKKTMTDKDRENLLLLTTECKWPGKRAYNRLLKAAIDGYLEMDLSVPEMKEIHDNLSKFEEYKPRYGGTK